MKPQNPADFFSKKKKLFEIKQINKETIITEGPKAEAKMASKAKREEAHDSFEREVEAATRDFITNTLHRLAVDYAAKHHEHGVTVTDLIKRGLAEIKRELEQSK